MMRVYGVSLHYFDSDQNHDKFYRAFVYPDGQGGTCATYHWGRANATGQTKTEVYESYPQAFEAIEAKVNLKMRKGYEFLGQGDIEVTSLGDVRYVGRTLALLVGHKPTKVGGGFSLIIDEEADLMDLLSR